MELNSFNQVANAALLNELPNDDAPGNIQPNTQEGLQGVSCGIDWIPDQEDKIFESLMEDFLNAQEQHVEPATEPMSPPVLNSSLPRIDFGFLDGEVEHLLPDTADLQVQEQDTLPHVRDCGKDSCRPCANKRMTFCKDPLDNSLASLPDSFFFDVIPPEICEPNWFDQALAEYNVTEGVLSPMPLEDALTGGGSAMFDQGELDPFAHGDFCQNGLNANGNAEPLLSAAIPLDKPDRATMDNA